MREKQIFVQVGYKKKFLLQISGKVETESQR